MRFTQTVPKTCLQLRFRVWGPKLDPERLTAELGIEPTKSFHVGERHGAAVQDKAGWEWWSDWGGWDTDPLVVTFVELFSPGESVLRSCVEEGATIALAVVGNLGADLIMTQDEAENRGYGFEDGDVFAPFLDCDRVGLGFDAYALRLLASISASLDTHIDIDLDDGEEGCS